MSWLKGCVPMLFDSYSAASDIVYHNENGILVQPFDCNEYAAETKKLMDNPEKTSELALNAYENVLRFSYEETYKKWEKVFEKINSWIFFKFININNNHFE